MKGNQHLKIVMALSAAMVVLSQHRVDATITNVAAVAGAGGNTVRTSDGDNGTGTWIGGGGGSTWAYLTDTSFVPFSTVIPGPTEFINQNSVSTGTAPALTMTVTPFDPLGIYSVYVIYQTDDTGPAPGGSTPFPNAEYNIQAGISSNSLSVFGSTSGGYTGGNRVISAGARYLNERRVLVGTETGPTLSLYIADYIGLPSAHDNETRWEGMAYEQIGQIPEPTATLLLGVGGFVLWRRIRK